jgi:hypothetical protein
MKYVVSWELRATASEEVLARSLQGILGIEAQKASSRGAGAHLRRERQSSVEWNLRRRVASVPDDVARNTGQR